MAFMSAGTQFGTVFLICFHAECRFAAAAAGARSFRGSVTLM
jgi:hypothetical protein